MTSQVDAVIHALRCVLEDAERFQSSYWETRTINRWINQLPGASTFRWRHLKLRGNSNREVSRLAAIIHLRATISYLEANRTNIETPSLRLPQFRRAPKPEYRMVEGPTSDTRH